MPLAGEVEKFREEVVYNAANEIGSSRFENVPRSSKVLEIRANVEVLSGALYQRINDNLILS